MRTCEQGLRPSVRSTLMIGAAGAAVTFGAATAIADSSDAKAPPSINKYLPYAQIGGTSGDSMSTGGITLFIPAWQALNQLLFVKIGGDLQSSEGDFSTFGLGYRQKIAPTWIIGFFGNYDHTHTKLNDDFSQFVFGAELLNPNWEFHANSYFADTSKIDLIKDSARLEVDGNDIAIVREQEAPYSGFDGSGGYRVFKTPGSDGRLYAGGFYFKTSNEFDTKAIAGPKVGFEFNVYDLDFIGPQSRLQVQGEVRNDSVRGDSGFLGVNLRVPINIDPSGPGAQALDELDRRMVDDPQTQTNVLTQSEFNKPEPVIIYGGNGGRTHPTNTIFYVDNSTGAGSYPNPTTFTDATTRAGPDALIVLTTKDGAVTGQGNLSSGDMLIGAGTTLTIKGAETGYKFTHTFAPGEHDSSISVPTGATAITLASDNALYNFAITGSFGTAIAGNNVGTATIRNVTITGDGSEGQKGVALTQDSGSKLDLLMTDTSVADVGSDGISIATHLDGASTLAETIALSNVSVSNAGGNGVTVTTEASGGAHVTQDITFDDVSVAGAGSVGIGIAGFAEGDGSQLIQTGAINNATVSAAGFLGIGVYAYTSSGGTLTQNVSIDPTTVNTSGYALGIGAVAEGGTLDQTVTVTDFSGSGNTDGVEIYAYGDGGASLYQTAMLSNVSFDAVGHDGVRILAHSTNGAYVNQGVEFDGLTLNGAGLYDIAVEAYADGGAIRQTAIFNNVTVNGTAQSAINIYGEAGNGGEGFAHVHALGGEGGENGGEGGYYALIQNVLFHTATINTQGDGFYAGLKTSNGDSASQYVSFDSDSSITSYNGGVTVYANASGNSVLRQTVHLPQTTLVGSIGNQGGEGGEGGYNVATGGGIHIEAHSYDGSTVNSYTLIDSAQVTYAAQAGISIAGYAQGGNINQTVKLNNANITSYYATGISIYGYADGATLNQNALFNNVTVTGSGNPFTATAKGLNSGTVNQYVSFTDDSALNSTHGYVSGTVIGGKYGLANQTLLFPDIDASGVSIGAEAYSGATTHQGASFNYVLAFNSGLSIGSSALTNGSVTQTATANNVVASFNGGNGIELIGLVSAGGHLSQYLDIDTATLTNDGESGFLASLFALNGGNALQIFSFGSADTDGSATGILLRESMVGGGTEEQDATLNNISAQYEAQSGIALYANSDGSAVQRANVNGLTASHDGHDGIRVAADTHYGSAGQYINVANATLTYDNNGVNIYASGYGGASHQQVTLTNLTVNAGNIGAGLLLAAQGDAGADLYQAVTATNSHFDNNSGGIVANNRITGGASLHQGIGLYSSSVDYNLDGISIYTYASGANAVYNNLIVQYADVSHNDGGNGIDIETRSSGSAVIAQSANIKNTTLNVNGFGLYITSQGHNDGMSYQSIVSANDVFSGNNQEGLFESAQDSQSLRQVLSSTGDTFTANYFGGIYQNAFGGLVSQSSSITGDTITGNDSSPVSGSLFIGAYSNTAGSYLSRSITNTTVSDPGGIRLSTVAGGGSVLNETAISGTTVTRGFVSDYVAGRDGGFAGEYLTLTNDSVTGGGGVFLRAYGYGGTALQHAAIDGLTATADQAGLLAMTEAENANSIAAQYLNISNSHFDNNSNYGLFFVSHADGGGAVTGQSVAIDNSSANGNTRGMAFEASGTYGGSANQYGHLDDVTITGNSLLGILVSGTSHNLGFAAQTFILTGTSDANSVVSGSNYGIVIDAAAYAGGNVEQGIGIYNTLVSGIRHDGVAISGNAYSGIGGSAGYYYSHVAQNLNAYYDSFSHNGGNGVSISNVANGGAQINSFAYLKGDTIDYNAGEGLHVYSHAGAGSNVYDDIYMLGGSASHNTGSGIVINSYADQSTYLIQNIAVIGATVNNNGGGENGGNGFVDNAHAQGPYSLNGQYITLANSTFDGNNGAGAVFEAAQTYGPGSFGVARQYLTVVGSDFSHNAHDGLYAITDASGEQGRAEQHFTISGSQFDSNGGDGIHLKNYVTNGVLNYGTNSDGTYPLTCNYVQGADGGCAFVRQTVDIADSDISKNGGDGIYISTVLNHYAAAYNVGGRPLYTPTLYLNNVTVDHNGANGLHISNTVADNSYEYQYIVAVNSHFDHNQGYGILSGSGVSGNSSLNQKIVLASVGGEGGLLSSADNNGLGGISIQTGASYAGTVLNALVLAYTDVSHNGGYGVTMNLHSTDVAAAVQSFQSTGSNFANNSGVGVSLYAHSAGDGVAVQTAQSYYDTFTKNNGIGLKAVALDTIVSIGDADHTTAVAAQSIISVGDSFTNNAGGGILELGYFQAPSIAYQKLYVSGDTFNANGTGDSSSAQLNSNFRSGSANGTVYRTVLNSSFAGGEGNAIDFNSTAMPGGFIVDQTVISGNTIRNAGGDGIRITGVAANDGAATLYQLITMNADHVYGSVGDGVDIAAQAGTGGKVIQDIAIDGLVSRGNGANGLYLSTTAFNGVSTIAAQYVQISNSTFSGNGSNGVIANAIAFGAGEIADQQISMTNTQLLSNGGNGFGMSASAFQGASTQQYALLTGVNASHNAGDGIHISAYATEQGFAAQGFSFNGSSDLPASVSHNGGDGFDISARAVNGGEIEQNAGIYYANIAHNSGDGINISTYAQGSYPGVTPYYSHVSQSISTGYGSITHNAGDGVSVVNSAGSGTGLNQYLGFYNENISSNTGKGIYEHSIAEAYVGFQTSRETYLYSDLYVIGGNVTKNGGESGGGIDVRSYADGATYMIQHIVVQGVHVDGNHGDGLSVIGSARGLYSLNIQYITLAGSTFDHNNGNGAHIDGHQYYGGFGSFGAVLQYVTVQQSDLSHNGGNGLAVNALATDEQGRVGQTISITGSIFDNNGGDGIHLTRTAANGTYRDGYSCNSVQGLYGGCAFVRQTVQIGNSDISHNNGDGLYIGTTASNYGAVYSTGERPKNTPTVVIYDTTLDHNGGDGLHLVNNADGGSDIYQYVVAIDSHFNHNAGYGIEAHNTVTGGSTLFQNIVLYHYVPPDRADAGPLPPMSVDNNGKGGVHIDAYAGTGASVYEGLTLIHADVSHNTGDGVNVSLNANGAAQATQVVHSAYSSFVGNTGDGIHVNAYGLNGAKLSQIVTSRNDYFAHSGGDGLYVGFKENGVAKASQQVASYFDDFAKNGGGLNVSADFIGGTGKLSSGVLVGSDSIHGGKYGINVSLAASDGAHVAGFQKISYSSISNVSGDGIGISLTGDTNAKWHETAQILGNGVSYAAHDGIAVDFTLSNNAHLSANPAYQSAGIVIQGNTITGHSSQGGEGGNYAIGRSHDGIYVGFTVNSGASLYEPGGERGVRPFTAVIDNNKISYVRGDGIEVATNNNGGTLDENSLIYGNSVYYATHSGIIVSHTENGGQSRVGESIHDNHVYANNFFGGERGGRYGNEAGIEVTVTGNGGGLQDFASIYSNTTEGHDIGVAIEVHGDKNTRQSADIYGNTIDRNGDGIYGLAAGSSSQYVSYASNVMSFNGGNYDFHHAPGATQILN